MLQSIGSYSSAKKVPGRLHRKTFIQKHPLPRLANKLVFTSKGKQCIVMQERARMCENVILPLKNSGYVNATIKQIKKVL